MQTLGQIKLKEHLTGSEARQYQFAEEVETTPATVSRWLSGKARPTDDMKRRIEAATEKAVLAADWLEQATAAEQRGAA